MTLWERLRNYAYPTPPPPQPDPPVPGGSVVNRTGLVIRDIGLISVVESQITVNVGASQLVAKANPMRLALLMGGFQAGTVFLSTKQQPTAQGLSTSNTLKAFEWNWKDQPALCQHEWWATAGGAAGLTVVECILLR